MEIKDLYPAIIRLKRDRSAVILAHNYQRPEIQDVADFVGDSLELSLCAAETDAEVIVFCGVDFMAETAAILNPDKRVLIPDRNALCPMAAMLPGELVQLYRERHPSSKVVLYINTLAEAKAHADALCTSANSAEIIDRMDSDTVLFGPDSNLARYAENHSHKKIVSIPEYGFCPVHMLFNVESISKLKIAHPEAEVLAHPECTPGVCAVADFVEHLEDVSAGYALRGSGVHRRDRGWAPPQDEEGEAGRGLHPRLRGGRLRPDEAAHPGEALPLAVESEVRGEGPPGGHGEGQSSRRVHAGD